MTRSPSPAYLLQNDSSFLTGFDVSTPEDVVATTHGSYIVGTSAAASIAYKLDSDTETPPQPPARKLCVRHQRMADEGTITKLQQVR